MPREGECGYCGRTRIVTREHVIAKKFFPKGMRENLPIIPACFECNNRKSSDEQYVMSVLPWMYECGGHPAVDTLVRGDIRERLERSPALARTVLRDLGHETVQLPTGILLPRQLVFAVDVSRIKNVLRYIVRGLHHYELKRSFPEGTEYEVLPFISRQTARYIMGLFLQSSYGRHRDLKNGVFEYAFMLEISHPNVTTWLMSFYRGFNVVVRTVSDVPLCDVTRLIEEHEARQH